MPDSRIAFSVYWCSAASFIVVFSAPRMLV